MHRHDERRGPRGLWIAYGVYASVTVVLPLARGAHGQAGYWEHAAITLGVAALVLLLCSGMVLGTRRLLQRFGGSLGRGGVEGPSRGQGGPRSATRRAPRSRGQDIRFDPATRRA